MRRAHLREEVLHVRSRFERQRPAQLAVQGMLDNDVENPHAVIGQDLKLLLGSLRRVLAGQNRPVWVIGPAGQPITSRRGQDFLATGPQDCDVLDQALAAYMKMPRQLTSTDRGAVGAHPCDNPAAALLG